MAALWLTLLAVPQGWLIQWEVNDLNVGLQLITECKGREPFYAVDFIPVGPDQYAVTTRRQPTPKGERCTVLANVMRNNKGGQGSPEDDYIGESSIIVEEQ